MLDTQGGTQYVSTGWAMTGNEPASGSCEQLRDDADERRGADVAVGDELPVHGDGAVVNGSVSGSTNGWYALGGSVTVTAMPDAHYHFAGWTGDVQARHEQRRR